MTSTSTPASAKELTEIFVPWLQTIGLVVAGIFALFEYHSHVEDVKVERSIDYVIRLNSGELLASVTKLSTQYQRQFARFEATHPPNLPANKITADYYDFVLYDVLMFGKDKSLEADINSVIGFLDNSLVCSQSSLCDEATIKSYLGDFGKGIIQSYRPYLCYLRKLYNDNSYASRVMEFYAPSSRGDGCVMYDNSIEKTLASPSAVSPSVSPANESLGASH